MLNIKRKLTCNFCDEIYKDPILLNCCGESIWKHHVQELISNNSSNKFTCPLCNEQNENQNLQVSKLIQRLVEIELHELKLDSKYLKSFNNLKAEIASLEKILKCPESFIYEEMHELKRQVDLEKEKLRAK